MWNVWFKSKRNFLESSSVLENSGPSSDAIYSSIISRSISHIIIFHAFPLIQTETTLHILLILLKHSLVFSWLQINIFPPLRLQFAGICQDSIKISNDWWTSPPQNLFKFTRKKAVGCWNPYARSCEKNLRRRGLSFNLQGPNRQSEKKRWGEKRMKWAKHGSKRRRNGHRQKAVEKWKLKK